MESPIPWLLSKDCAPYFALIGIIWVYICLKYLAKNLLWCMRTYSPAFYRPVDYVRIYGDWAAVTGCTSGLGLAIAEELARRGINIVLISRTESKLLAVANKIENKFKVKTKIIIDNAFSRESTDMMAKELSKLDIGILVNNVGIHYVNSNERLDQVSPSWIYNMLTVNTGNAAMTIKHVVPRMVARRQGMIMNICSSSCYMPVPMQSLYSATKVYTDVLTKALSSELSGSGVKVQSICPLLVQSNMTQEASYYVHNFLSIKGETFARGTIDKIGACRRTSGYWLSDITIGASLLLNQTFEIYVLYYIMILVKVFN